MLGGEHQRDRQGDEHQVDDEQLESELAGSRSELEARGLGTCNAIAWPYGMHNDRAIQAAGDAGYRGTFLAEYYWHLRFHADPMRVHRVGVDASRGVFGLAFTLGRGYDLMQWLKRFRSRKAY